MPRLSKSQQAEQKENDRLADALAEAFGVTSKARSLLPSLCFTLRAHGWEKGLIDQTFGDGIDGKSKGGVVAGLQRAGVITLEKMESCATIGNQKLARLTAKSRQVLIKAKAKGI